MIPARGTRGRWWKTFFLVVLMLGAGIEGAVAQLRLDTSLYMSDRVIAGTLPGNHAATLVPVAQAGWQLDLRNIRAGIGLAAIPLYFENVMWLGVFGEYDLNPFVLRADLGGGRVLVLSAYDPVLQTAILPQVEVSVKLTSWFRLGVGVLAYVAPGNQDVSPRLAEFSMIYLGARIVWAGAGGSSRR